MTPGTRPSRRTARAAPLPARGRAVAFNSLTVAIVEILRVFAVWDPRGVLPGGSGPRTAGLYRPARGLTRKPQPAHTAPAWAPAMQAKPLKSPRWSFGCPLLRRP